MRLNVPPTLKQSALIDSHSLSANSPINLNSRGFKRSSKLFKEDGHSQFDDATGFNQMMTTHSRRQNNCLLLPQSGSMLQKKKSLQFQDDCKVSEASFLKRMPLFNQYEEESNFSQIRLSQIPKKQLDYQEDFNEQQLPAPLSSRLKRKSSSGDLQSSIDRSPQALLKGLKRLKSIDVINEQSSSSQGNSLNGSRKMQQKASLISSLRKTTTGKGNQQSPALQPIQEYSKQKHGIAESSSSYSKGNESSSLQLRKQIEQLRKNNVIQMSDVESQREVSRSNPSQKSCKTVHLKSKITDEQQQRSPQSPKNRNKIQQKLMQIQKSLKLNDDYSMWEGTEVDPSMASFRKQSEKFSSQKPLNDSEKKMFTNMNERFQKMKEIKYGSSVNAQSSNLPQSSSEKQLLTNKYMILSSIPGVYQQKSTQTDATYPQNVLPQQNIRQIHKRYADQIQTLQKQNMKLHKQVSMNNDSMHYLEMMKDKFEEENKYLQEKIKRLERILEKNEKELTEWKDFAKQGRVESPKVSKENQAFKENNGQWKDKQNNYLNRISSLQKQLQKANYLLKSMNQKETKNEQLVNISKGDKKYKQHLQNLLRYEQNLTKNMEIIKREQQKIIQEWRLIDQFHLSVNMRHNNNTQRYHFQTMQRQQSSRAYVNTVSFRADQDHYFKDNDVASISAKVKAMRTQLARDTR